MLFRSAICGSISFKSRGSRNYPEVKGHDSVKDWQAGFFYVKNEVAPGTDGIPAFVPTRAEENEYWAGRGQVPTDPYLLRCIKRIDRLMMEDLKGLDLVLCWMKRRIQPLQYRPKLMCEYSGKAKDEMHTTKNYLSSDALTLRMKDLVRIRDYDHGFTVMMDMPENGKITAVSSVLEFLLCS